ncbi:MAG: M28 family peptidase, partial [Chloroflexota bacterium]
YIADQFKALGVQPAGEALSYFQTKYRDFVKLAEDPKLSFTNFEEALIYKQDYAVYSNSVPIENINITGNIEILLLKEVTTTQRSFTIPLLDDLDFSNEIVMVFGPEEIGYLRRVSHLGIIIVSDNPKIFNLNQTLLPSIATARFSGGQFKTISGPPIFWISADLANKLLAQSGYTLAQLREIRETANADEVFQEELNIEATLEIEVDFQDRVPVKHVLGFIPGEAAIPGVAKLDDQMIVIAAQYDMPPSSEGEHAGYALDNASGIAMMLETIRVLMDSGYQPYRTIYFVAYSGEGTEGGAIIEPTISKFLQARLGFTNAYTPIGVIELRGIGVPNSDGILIRPGSSLRLTRLFETAAQQLGVASSRQRAELDLGIIFSQPNNLSFSNIGEEAPQLGLNTDGWEEFSHLPTDTMENISRESLENAGKVISYALMIMAREIDY